MEVLIIRGTPRRAGNLAVYTATVADELRTLGHSVDTVDLYDLRLGPCRSCDACRDKGRCVFADDFGPLAAQMLAADLVIIATPVYWFTVSGVVKQFMDRTQSIWHQRQLKGKRIAALITMAHAGADETSALLASFAKYHEAEWLGSSVVRTRDQRDLVATSPELAEQARAFARQLIEPGRS